MALFENYERRIDQITAVLNQYGIKDIEEAEKITFFAYEELLAFKRACQTLGLTKQDVEDVMYNNAMNMIEDARKSIYGE